MTTIDVRVADDKLMHGIDELDLSMISLKLSDPEEGLGWSDSYCQQIALEYRRYLALSRQYPERAIVPSKIVDNFWHFHILDTQAYARDCQNLFGFFLHHSRTSGCGGRTTPRRSVTPTTTPSGCTTSTSDRCRRTSGSEPEQPVAPTVATAASRD